MASALKDDDRARNPLGGASPSLAPVNGHGLPGRVKPPLPFRAVNQPGNRDYDPGLQRHHLLPKQLMSKRCFGAMFEAIGPDRVGFDDFRRNGLLLPSQDATALRMGLPMHRGPHRDYNALVIERVGQIEARWSTMRGRTPQCAGVEAVQRLTLLKKALRRRLLSAKKRPLILNRYDPMQRHVDFTEVDAMVDLLWADTQDMVDLGL